MSAIRMRDSDWRTVESVVVVTGIALSLCHVAIAVMRVQDGNLEIRSDNR